ncbi:hypothetical protein HQN90_00745 [Paenibacillus alba]|nr:hypothetical protein [Paenibacillus alba]
MSKQYISNTIEMLEKLQASKLYCNSKKSEVFGEGIFYGSVYDILQRKIDELKEAFY